MLGVLFVFALSWVILWFYSKEHINALGILPSRRRIKEFFIGALVMAIFCFINHCTQAHFQDVQYVRNAEYGFLEALNGTWWTFKAALFEELIFRGALLYILIKMIGSHRACLLSAMAFGIYHWFSYGMFGRGIIPMAYVFLLTGAAGYMFAISFAISKSILVPLGLHFGWILISIVFLSAGPLGDSTYVISGDPVDLGGWEQLWVFLFQTVVIPGLIIWYFLRKYHEPSIPLKTNGIVSSEEGDV